jgi:hypothetical protein
MNQSFIAPIRDIKLTSDFNFKEDIHKLYSFFHWASIYWIPSWAGYSNIKPDMGLSPVHLPVPCVVGNHHRAKQMWLVIVVNLHRWVWFSPWGHSFSSLFEASQSNLNSSQVILLNLKSNHVYVFAWWVSLYHGLQILHELLVTSPDIIFATSPILLHVSLTRFLLILACSYLKFLEYRE